jgi:DNA polymerase-3 subunit epsilon
MATAAPSGFPIPLERPLIVFDLEATGTNPRADRIVELASIKLGPDGSREELCRRFNPGCVIPEDVIEIHGISNEDVAECPRFEEVARELLAYFRDCDLAGYNLINYDIPLLVEEFQRASLGFSIDDCRVLDAQRIFHRRAPRDLAAAVRFYCGGELENAHSAAADVEATLAVIQGQFATYEDLPRTMPEIDSYCMQRGPNWADRMGRLKWVGGELAINFGKKQGAKVRELLASDPQYLRWIVRSDFPRDTREMIQAALDGELPVRESTETEGG